MKHLPIEIESFGFVTREKKNGRIVANRCGRDFLYYALHYYYPHQYGPGSTSPTELESKFGARLPYWLMWTLVQFSHVPQYLKEKDLALSINKRNIKSFFDFIYAFLFSRISYAAALKKIELSIERGNAVGIDLSIGYGGLYDHVLFGYGLDEENLYVCDTHQVPHLEYEKIREGGDFLMKLPKRVIQKRWTRFGRVWEVCKI